MEEQKSQRGNAKMGQAGLKAARSNAGSIRMSRLAIVQWLPKGDAQTGSDIRDRMLKRVWHETPIELIDCDSAAAKNRGQSARSWSLLEKKSTLTPVFSPPASCSPWS